MRTLRRLSGLVAASLLVGAGITAPAVAGPVVPTFPTTKGALTWGSNAFGQLGHGTPVAYSQTPVEPVNLHTGVEQISAGGQHTVAVLDAGQVMAWGRNDQGQLGNGMTVDYYAPTTVPRLGWVTQVSAGGAHTLALTSDGRVWAWGDNAYGQLGDGSLLDRVDPVLVLGLSNIRQVSAGWGHSLAIDAGGRVWAWGRNDHGQLGDGTVANRATPVATLTLTGVVQVSAGTDHSLALRSDRGAWSWGSNVNGQLGSGTFTDHYTPRPVPFLRDVTQVAAGRTVSLFLIGGVPHQWGKDIFCTGGDGTLHCPGESAAFFVVPVHGVTQISADLDCLAVRSDGTVWRWDPNPLALGSEEPTPDDLDAFQVKVDGVGTQADAGRGHDAVVVDRPMVNQQ